MRITDANLAIIRDVFTKHFGLEDHLWVFGSRVDDARRGGDLDFYVETHQDSSRALKSKLAFVNDLWRFLGDQKIDVVLNVLSIPTSLLIYTIAKQTGIQIL